MLDPILCRARQRRLLAEMSRRQLDLAVLSSRHHVYWLTGHWAFWLHESAAILRADGHLTLVSANASVDCAAADDVLSFPATRMGTQDQEQPAFLAAVIEPLLTRAKRAGLDSSPVAAHLLSGSAAQALALIDTELHQLRRRKEADELRLMRRAIDCCRAMYARAGQIIEPGVSELTVFSELHAAAVASAGEVLTPMHLGNDFACGVGGGPPRPRAAKAGEIYILDLGPAYRGYFADNARCFAVGRQPTDLQHQIWEALTGVFPIIEHTAKPGVRCRELFDAGKAHLLEKTGRTLDHHLGHGVGLQPHEYPHISPMWDDTLAVGDVFTIEPGLYGPEINGGMRIENQYLVTETGVENLTPFPLGLS